MISRAVDIARHGGYMCVTEYAVVFICPQSTNHVAQRVARPSRHVEIPGTQFPAVGGGGGGSMRVAEVRLMAHGVECPGHVVPGRGIEGVYG